MKSETLQAQMAPYAAAREQGSQNAAVAGEGVKKRQRFGAWQRQSRVSHALEGEGVKKRQRFAVLAEAPHEIKTEAPHETDETTETTKATFTPPKYWRLILGLYLAGIAMGALDTAIVNPARTVIQDSLGVGDQSGVWIFTIYTLAYAAGIPVIGKLADLVGRKPVFLTAIGLFAAGSLGCGLAQVTGSFELLLASRVVQAVGGGGIMPVATAAVTTVVPAAKQGRALGLVGMVYGVTSVLGAGAGSLILALVGASQWQWIFFINLPVAAVVIGLGVWVLPRQDTRDTRQLDLGGIVLLVVGISALLWGFQHLDFAHLETVGREPNAWAALVVALALAPLFWWWETRLEARGGDPIINFRYFATPALGATLLVGAVAGFLMMTIMFVPQFAEFTLDLPRGAGGFPTVLVGLASAVGAPLSGRLTDRFGPRFVLGLGLGISALSGALLVFWALPFPGLVSSLVALGLMGLGMGFLMGAPLSYLVLHLVPVRDANSGQATLSLVRSVATTLAPAVLVGFLATGAGSSTSAGSNASGSAGGSISSAGDAGGLFGFFADVAPAWLSLFHEKPALGFARMFGCYTLVSLLGLLLLLTLPSPSQMAPHEPRKTDTREAIFRSKRNSKTC